MDHENNGGISHDDASANVTPVFDDQIEVTPDQPSNIAIFFCMEYLPRKEERFVIMSHFEYRLQELLEPFKISLRNINLRWIPQDMYDLDVFVFQIYSKNILCKSLMPDVFKVFDEFMQNSEYVLTDYIIDYAGNYHIVDNPEANIKYGEQGPINIDYYLDIKNKYFVR